MSILKTTSLLFITACHSSAPKPATAPTTAMPPSDPNTPFVEDTSPMEPDPVPGSEAGASLGHGAGTGAGGGMGSRTSVPAVRFGQPQSVGDLDKAIIRRYIKRNVQKITFCYEQQLLARPGLEGTVNAQFFIDNTGRVTDSRASGVDADVSACVAGVIKAIEFPKPKGGGGVSVNYPFNFRPTGG